MVDFKNPAAVKIRKQMVESISRYKLIEAGDRVMVCVSGGKDSSVLLALLSETRRRAPYSFDIEAVMLDQKQPGFDASDFKNWVETQLAVKLTILEKDTYKIVKEKTTTGVYCTLCSRLRRGILYEHAVQKGFTKLALGHHREDSAQTLLLNLFYTGKLQAMPPKFMSDDSRNTVIRPLFAVAESDLETVAQDWKIPIIPCNLCGTQEGLKRKQVKKLVSELEKTIPGIRQSMAAAITNVKTSHLADEKIWDFRDLSAHYDLEGVSGGMFDADL